jgi:sulfonate transport system substrate-binding protein
MFFTTIPRIGLRPRLHGAHRPVPQMIVVGGVPEHFNLPLQRALSGAAEARFEAVPGGTGAMMSRLKDGSLDVSVALTEGSVMAVAQSLSTGDPLCIVGPYVTSSLRWGVAVANDGRLSSFKDVASLEAIRIGVSRLGSGSHLMSFLLAEREGWDVGRIEFVPCGSIDGLRTSLREGSSDIFLWEQGMLDPFVRDAEVSLIGSVDTPWPCFVLVTRRSWLDGPYDAHRSNRDVLSMLRTAWTTSIREFLSDRDAAIAAVRKDFALSAAAAAEWVANVAFASEGVFAAGMLVDVAAALRRVGAVSAELEAQCSFDALTDASLARESVAIRDSSIRCIGCGRRRRLFFPERRDETEAERRAREGRELLARSRALLQLERHLRSIGASGFIE